MTYTTYQKPKALKKGDKIALIAPSSPVSSEKFQLSMKSLEVLDLEAAVFPSCHMKHGYLSGADNARAADINAAFSDPSVDGIFCLRGGYGSTRLLPLLDYEMIRSNPKMFIGYSDITALHTMLNQQCHMATLHSPMPTRGWDTLDPLSLESLTCNLFSARPAGVAPIPPGQPLERIVPGACEGIITGGNLSLLTATLGSPYEIDTNGKILFLEDVDEKNYRLDKGLTALALAGKFRDCAGIILGTFAGCGDPDVSPQDNLTLRQIFDEVVAPFCKPTVNNFRAGHIYPHVSIPMGTMVRLDASKEEVVFLEALTAD